MPTDCCPRSLNRSTREFGTHERPGVPDGRLRSPFPHRPSVLHESHVGAAARSRPSVRVYGLRRAIAAGRVFPRMVRGRGRRTCVSVRRSAPSRARRRKASCTPRPTGNSSGSTTHSWTILRPSMSTSTEAGGCSNCRSAATTYCHPSSTCNISIRYGKSLSERSRVNMSTDRWRWSSPRARATIRRSDTSRKPSWPN